MEPSRKTKAEFAAGEMTGWIEMQTALGPRRPASPAGRRNEELLAKLLEEFGLEHVRREPIAVTRWEAQDWSLEVQENNSWTRLESFPIPYTAHTPDTGVEGRLVFAGRRRLRQPGDWRGAVVVAEIGFPPLDPGLLRRVGMGVYDPGDTLADMQHPATWVRLGWYLYRLAVRRSAAAFVGIVADQPGGSCRMYAPYGFKERDIMDKPVPGVWVGRADGDRLRALARAGGTARLRSTGIAEPGETANVVGEIPGAGREAIVLSCHHDSPFTSPVEDASGVAVVLALAKHFAAHRDLRRRLVVLLSAGHFYGSIGTRTFLQRHAADTVADTVIEISIEHIAREAREDEHGRLVPTGQPEPTGFFVPFNRAVTDKVMQALQEHDLRRSLLLPPEGPLGDFPPTDGGDWYAAGVPVINCISNPVYLLTDDDAPQWVDTERLPRMAAAFADIIRQVDRLPSASIARVDSLARLALMKLLRRLVYAKTTCFGLKPVT